MRRMLDIRDIRTGNGGFYAPSCAPLCAVHESDVQAQVVQFGLSENL